jgi:hypothetical protein
MVRAVVGNERKKTPTKDYPFINEKIQNPCQPMAGRSGFFCCHALIIFKGPWNLNVPATC